jgi:hypothetical protein
MVKRSEPHEVWLGVGLRVEAASPEEATRKAVAWLRASLEATSPQDGLHVTAPALDLVEPVVRAIQQMGREKARDERQQAQQAQQAQPDE